MRLVVLDTGPLGLILTRGAGPAMTNAANGSTTWRPPAWRVFVPEIADYEVRRELLRVGATAGLRRLDQVKATLDYAALTTAVILRAAELWAAARRAGRPRPRPRCSTAIASWRRRRCWRPDQATW